MTSMESTTEAPSLVERVSERCAAFAAAHMEAETAAAMFTEIRRLVGSNEADRKTAKANTPPEEYAQLLRDYAGAEKAKIETTAHLERTEKELNVLREMLQRETAQITLKAAELQELAAQRYAVMTGTKTTFAELRARYPLPKPVLAGDVAEEDLPF